MAKRGPKPKPLEALSPRRRQERAAAARESGPCPAPTWLAPPEAEEYESLRRELTAAGVGAALDEGALARLAVYRRRWRSALEAEDAEAMRRLEMQLVRLEREFGLTPVSRRGLGLAATPEDEAARLADKLGIVQ